MAKISDNAQKVLEARYLLRNSQGELIEGPEDLYKRVANTIAAVESHWGLGQPEIQDLAQSFRSLMVNGDFLPNSPTLMNAGKAQGQLSACFVLPVPDNLEGIFETCKNAALIHKTGGGTGFSFSRVRPDGDIVDVTSGVASGPVSFMMVYDAATEAIRQGGVRRGANMGILRIDHPDIEDFIACKSDLDKLNNFNISVAITNKFMDAVQSDSQFELINPRTGQVACVKKANYLFDLIVKNAHGTGEPGIVFLDRIIEKDPISEARDASGNLIPGTEAIEATNPCGEQPLGPGDACNLGSINLANMVKDGKIDYAKLANTITLAVRFLDDVVEANHYPMLFIDKAARNNRRIGLGVMGWAECLIKCGIAYNTNEAVSLAQEVMSFIQKKAREASEQLGLERGVFPNHKYSRWAQEGLSVRNLTCTAIAPTGTISMLANTSSGIEPLFALSYVRRVLAGTELNEANDLFKEIAQEKDFYSEALMQEVAERGTLEDIDGVPEEYKKLFVCSHQIGYSWHVKMQAAFQQFTDCAVSKTINFAHEASPSEIRLAYLSAWKQGLKGITVYRDGCRADQVLNLAKTKFCQPCSQA